MRYGAASGLIELVPPAIFQASRPVIQASFELGHEIGVLRGKVHGFPRINSEIGQV